MRRLLYIILYVVLAASASAQVKVTGRVIDLQNKPVSDVIVKLVSGTKTLAFTSSNARGEYSLELKSAPTGEVSLQFTHISYEKESERLTLKQSGITNPLQRKVDMILTPKSISLKEVTYLDESGTGQTCSTYTTMTSSTTSLSEGWYVVNDDVTIS